VKGKIVLVPFPFTDLSALKKRPALILVERDMDVLVAFISSQIPLTRGPGMIIITTDLPEFSKTGLKKNSVIHIDKLATLSKAIILGEIGELGPKLKKMVNKAIRQTIKI